MNIISIFIFSWKCPFFNGSQPGFWTQLGRLGRQRAGVAEPRRGQEAGGAVDGEAWGLGTRVHCSSCLQNLASAKVPGDSRRFHMVLPFLTLTNRRSAWRPFIETSTRSGYPCKTEEGSKRERHREGQRRR